MDPIVDPEQSEFEDALMRVGRDVRMSPELRNKTLAALGVGVAVGETTTSVAKAGTVGWLSGKTGTIVVATGLVGALGVAGAVALSAGRSAPPDDGARAPVATVEERASRTPQAAAESEPDEPTPEIDADAPAQPPDVAESDEVETPAASAEEGRRKPRAASTQHPPASEASGLREELSHIARVEGALQAGNPARALDLLAEYRRRFPRPRLGLEAEVLTIQALSENGSSAAARKRAARFLEKYPTSPLGARAKRYID